MNSKLFYKMMSGFYDLIDVIYFREKGCNPRKVVFDAIDDGDEVLDLCTGTATNALNIARMKKNTKVVGVDLSKAMLGVADEKVKKAGVHNLKPYCMDATKMQFADNSFDKILISLVLHEVEEDLAADLLNEAKRVLKEDGRLIVTEWEKSERLLHKILFFPIRLLEPKPFKKFIRNDIRKYFEARGFAVEKLSHCDYSRVLVAKK